MKEHVKKILEYLVDDPEREGLVDTPGRVEESLSYLTGGYKADIDAVMRGAVFEEEYDEMVIVRNISLYSLCEHHILPFFGKCHIAYIPKGRIIGLSRIPRIVDIFARRLQVQERLTSEIAKCLMSYLKPHGVAVTIEALHLCMAMRGVEEDDATIITSSMLGAFRKDSKTRMEFLDLVR